MTAYTPKTFDRRVGAPLHVFDPHGLRSHDRETQWRAGNHNFIGPVACPLWLWLRGGCSWDMPSSTRRAIQVALAKYAEGM